MVNLFAPQTKVFMTNEIYMTNTRFQYQSALHAFFVAEHKRRFRIMFMLLFFHTV